MSADVERDGGAPAPARSEDAGQVRVPVVRQTGASDCGLAVLEMVLRYYGAPYERHALRRLFGDTAGGSTLETIRAVAHACGLDAEGFEATVQALDTLPAPAILHWRSGHFVVFEGPARGGAWVVDPMRGRMRVSREALAHLYSGCALVLEPEQPAPADGGAAAPRGEARPDGARAVLAPWLRRERAVFARLAALALGMGAAAAAGAWLACDAFAGAVGGLAAVPALALAALCLGVAALLGTRAAAAEAQLRGSLGGFLAERFARVAGHASAEYLASRTERYLEGLAGDLDPTVNARFPSPRGARMLALALAATAASLVRAPPVGLAVVAALVGMAAVAEWRTRRWTGRALRWRPAVQGARERGRVILARPLDLRAAGILESALDGWRERHARAQALLGGARVAPPEPGPEVLGAALVGVALLAFADGPGRGTTSLVLGAAALVAGHLAVGELQRLRAWGATLAALADAELEAPAAAVPAEPEPGPGGGALRCRSLRLAARGSAGLAFPDLEVEPGEAVAVLGHTDARTAFAHLALGLVHPSGGTLSIDGMEVARLDEARRRALAAGVLAGAEPLAATILDNFRLVDPACGRPAVLEACARVGLGEWLAALPLGEHTLLTPGVLTGAVPRLLCLARLLVRLPRVLVLDGTLDELGAEQARSLARSLHGLPCTVVLCTGRPDVVPPEFRVVQLSPATG
jgi:predicted ABC-type transport system involved in lysophospholipase L1 biosynthesis ATPase subunit